MSACSGRQSRRTPAQIPASVKAALDAYPLTVATWVRTTATGLGGIVNKYYPSSWNGYQLFTTLQRLNIPSEMLYFSDEGHWVLKPQNSHLWYQTVNDWVDQWLKK